MFTALYKLFNFFLNDKDEKEEKEEKISNHDDEDSSDEEDHKSMTGFVTQVSENNDCGLIDGEVFFSFNTVLTQKPQVGTEVNYVASRENSGWKATQVVMVTEWEEEDSEEESVVGIISKFDGECGTINDTIPFNSDNIKDTTFRPYPGDYVTADVKKTRGNVLCRNVTPLRVLEKEGKISAVQTGHGYIDGEIFFNLCSCCEQYTPKKWDIVQAIAIESRQGKCDWRAISVKPANKATYIKCNPAASSTLANSTFSKDLLQDKNGIYVSVEVDFGKVRIGKKKKINVWIQNKGTSPQLYLNSYLPPESSQISIEGVKLLNEHSAMMQSGNTDVEKGKITLYPAMSMYINLTMHAQCPGVETQLLAITFEGFSIGRHVTATVIDPAKASRQNRGASPFDKYKASIKSGSGWVVPGVPPSFGKKKHKLKLPYHLPYYIVPVKLRDCVLNQEEVTGVVPELSQALTLQNYAKKMKTLLHLNEIQMSIDIRKFDLHRVSLHPTGEFLSLSVPGLSEGQPSILIGDQVILRDPTDAIAPIYEGFIHEVFNESVLIKFHKSFHASYSGEDYNVQFTFSRTPLRRSHQAVEFAVNMNMNVLFPDVLSPQSSLVYTMSTKKSDAQSQYYNKNFNEKQKAAVQQILHGQCRPLPYIIFGPPGTGKTVTVVEAILQVFTKFSHSRILVCTPSNSAADLIAERLHSSSVVRTCDMTRLNAMHRGEEDISSGIQQYCRTKQDLDMVSRYRIIVCTIANAGVLYTCGINTGHFTHVFVDEAGQVTEPECMIALNLAAGDGQIILSGDPKQLGPVLSSQLAKAYGLGLSYLERLMNLPLYSRNEEFAAHSFYNPLLVTKLTDNYRSHAAILSIYSKLFYDDELIEKADRNVTHLLCSWKMLPKKDFPVVFHGVRGLDLKEVNSPSSFNAVESVEVVRYVQGILSEGLVSHDDIGIISPYRKQVEKIRLLLDKLGKDSVKVGSVEEFQGQERKVIIISTVRSDEKKLNIFGDDMRQILGFVSDPKRFNVSISRAQALLIIIGNPYVLIQDKYWQVLIQYCIENGGYRGCDLPESLRSEEQASDDSVK